MFPAEDCLKSYLIFFTDEPFTARASVLSYFLPKKFINQSNLTLKTLPKYHDLIQKEPKLNNYFQLSPESWENVECVLYGWTYLCYPDLLQQHRRLNSKWSLS